MPAGTSPSYRTTLIIRPTDSSDTLAALVSGITDAGGSMYSVETEQDAAGEMVQEITFDGSSEKHVFSILEGVKGVPGIEVVDVVDQTFALHIGGKLDVCSKKPLENTDDLSMAYTPGVARVSMACSKDPALSFKYTVRRNMVPVPRRD